VVAAGEYDRAARELWGHTPAPSKAGAGLRSAAVLLTTARFVGRAENKQLLALLAQLATLTDAVTRLRESQDRAAQAAAARRAAEHVRITEAQRATAQTASRTPATQTRRSNLDTDENNRGRPWPGQGPDAHRGSRR